MAKAKGDNVLAGQIRKALEATGLTRLQIAKRSGVRYSAVHGFMAGTRDATLATASKLCELASLELCPVRRGKRKDGGA